MAKKSKTRAVGGFEVIGDTLPAGPKRATPVRENELASTIRAAIEAEALITENGWIKLKTYPSAYGATAAIKKLVKRMENGDESFDVEIELDSRRYEYAVGEGDEAETKKGSYVAARVAVEPEGEGEAEEAEGDEGDA